MTEKKRQSKCCTSAPTCCGSVKKACTCDCADTPVSFNEEWITGRVSTAIGEIPQASTILSFKDTSGSWKARWGINRMNYIIHPGLYCVGSPGNQSPVLVTANYKMSFDSLRSELSGMDAWIMVLDTKGINVWCAAGKGTFGTEEIVNRINKVSLQSIVSHRTLILPQLGAPGVSAHDVLKKSGFRVVYGPVRAADVTAFIKAGMKASPQMREVKFTFLDRLVLTPVEIVQAIKPALIIPAIFIILSLIGFNIFTTKDLIVYLGAIVAGCFATPVLLPWIPGRAFALKGWLMGVVWVAIVFAFQGCFTASLISWKQVLAYLLILPSLSAYLAMNFTDRKSVV